MDAYQYTVSFDRSSNMTPHTVHFRVDGKEDEWLEIGPSGKQCEVVSKKQHRVGSIVVPWEAHKTSSIYDAPQWGDVKNKPSDRGLPIIVSVLAAQALDTMGYSQLYVPHVPVRDAKGRIIGSEGLYHYAH